MSDLLPEMSACAVTFAGSFTPAIFQPLWFARQDLISEAEAEAATVDIIHPEVSQFSTERFTIHVTLERLQILSKPDSIAEPIRDLAIGIFFLLEHTPLAAMGVNVMQHFQLSSESEWHNLGDRLTPKAIWSEYLPDRPGMETITISSPRPSSGPGSKINVRVEPSRKLRHGVYFEVNNHFFPRDIQNARQEFSEILKSTWSELENDAARIANGVIRWAAAKELPESTVTNE